MWLYDAGIINYCYNLSLPELPLEGNSIDNQFKIYMNDTGLLMSMLEEGSGKDIIDGKLGIYKGAIFENIIAEIFTKLNWNVKKAIRLSAKNIGGTEKIDSHPLYMAMFL